MSLKSEKLFFFACPMLKIFNAAPLAFNECAVRGFDICPFVKAGKIEGAPIGEELIDRFGIIFSAKHRSAFETNVADGKTILFHTP